MTRVTVWVWVDKLLDGQTSDSLLSGWVDDGLTLDQMARKFEDDFGLTISRETIRRKLKKAA